MEDFKTRISSHTFDNDQQDPINFSSYKAYKKNDTFLLTYLFEQ